MAGDGGYVPCDACGHGPAGIVITIVTAAKPTIVNENTAFIIGNISRFT